MMKPTDMRANAEVYEAKFPGSYGLTFWSWEGLSAQQIATRVGTGRLPHPVMRKCTAGKIRSCVASDGKTLSLTRTGDEGHYTLALPSPLSDDDLVALGELFDDPEPNPVRRRNR
jgi:hypothetical protein